MSLELLSTEEQKQRPRKSISSTLSCSSKLLGATRVVMHGFNSEGGKFMSFKKGKQVKVNGRWKDVNLIIVDWSALAAPGVRWQGFYMTAASCAIEVGKYLGKCLNNMQVDRSQLHLFGHSLGGHGVGEAGRELARLGNRRKGFKPARVTGMDPAGPCFTRGQLPLFKCSLLSPRGSLTTPLDGNKIGKDSGIFVDIVHSNPGEMGSAKELGHVDYFVNGKRGTNMGNRLQTNCNSDKESHAYAVNVVVASIKGNQRQKFGRSIFEVSKLTSTLRGDYDLNTSVPCTPLSTSNTNTKQTTTNKYSSKWVKEKASSTFKKIFGWH